MLTRKTIPFPSPCDRLATMTPIGAAKAENSLRICTLCSVLRVCQSSSFLHQTKLKISRNLCLSATKVFLGKENSLRWVCPQGRWFSKIYWRVISYQSNWSFLNWKDWTEDSLRNPETKCSLSDRPGEDKMSFNTWEPLLWLGQVKNCLMCYCTNWLEGCLLSPM